MTLSELAKCGIDTVRLLQWAPLNYMKIDIIKKDGKYAVMGPWGHVHFPALPSNPTITTQDVLIIGDNSDGYLEYKENE